MEQHPYVSDERDDTKHEWARAYPAVHRIKSVISNSVTEGMVVFFGPLSAKRFGCRLFVDVDFLLSIVASLSIRRLTNRKEPRFNEH